MIFYIRNGGNGVVAGLILEEDYSWEPDLHVILFSDLFEKMVPMAVQQAMSIYNQRKTDYVNRLVGTMREATNLCNGYAATHFITRVCIIDILLKYMI